MDYKGLYDRKTNIWKDIEVNIYYYKLKIYFLSNKNKRIQY